MGIQRNNGAGWDNVAGAGPAATSGNGAQGGQGLVLVICS